MGVYQKRSSQSTVYLTGPSKQHDQKMAPLLWSPDQHLFPFRRLSPKYGLPCLWVINWESLSVTIEDTTKPALRREHQHGWCSHKEQQPRPFESASVGFQISFTASLFPFSLQAQFRFHLGKSIKHYQTNTLKYDAFFLTLTFNIMKTYFIQ